MQTDPIKTGYIFQIRSNAARWGQSTAYVAAKANAAIFAKYGGSTPENINFAIKTGAVRDFLDNSVVPYRTADPGAELKPAQIAANARPYTMLISCIAKNVDTAKQ